MVHDQQALLSMGKHKSFADVDSQEAARRAHSLVPKLRELAGNSDSARQLTPEVLALLRETGLLRILQPKRWGGMELDFVSVFDIPEIVGRGDASTSWNVGNLSVHHWMLALYDPRAQEEVWALAQSDGNGLMQAVKTRFDSAKEIN